MEDDVWLSGPSAKRLQSPDVVVIRLPAHLCHMIDFMSWGEVSGTVR